MIAKPDIFETAYFEGTKVNINDTTRLMFYVFDIGKVNLETGKIVACDPVMTYGQEPFKTQFPIGQFSAQLAIAKVNDGKNELVGFSRIIFSEKPVVNWEFALKKEQVPISVLGDAMYFYPVESGLGQFIDERSFKKLEKLEEVSNGQITDNLFEELEQHSRPSWKFANINYKDINIVSFSTGFGDGRYSTYVGYDINEEPCRLLTDFRLVDWLKK